MRAGCDRNHKREGCCGSWRVPGGRDTLVSRAWRYAVVHGKSNIRQVEGASNKQKPVGINNPNKDVYLSAADEHLAEKSNVLKGGKGVMGC